jgi:aminoglycoside phosphotransferase (APT) family kinase protein
MILARWVYHGGRYVRNYCRRSGRDPIVGKDWEFYLAYSMFRLVAILQSILRHALDGTAVTAEAPGTGSRARCIADVAGRTYIKRYPTIKGTSWTSPLPQAKSEN